MTAEVLCIRSGHDATTVFLIQSGLLLDDAHEPSLRRVQEIRDLQLLTMGMSWIGS